MIKIEEKIKELIEHALGNTKLKDVDFSIEHPVSLDHGDYSSNVAMVVAKQLGANPKQTADLLVEKMNKSLPREVMFVSVAGPGFINFKLTQDFFRKSLSIILDEGQEYGKNKNLRGKKVLVEYTDPNPFKQFHIGHLMNNTIGEAISRLLVWNGAKVTRACYQGDVGLHVAKALWGMIQNSSDMPDNNASLTEKTKFLGDAYVLGSKKYDEEETAKEEIKHINKRVYQFFDEREDTDVELEDLYILGKKWSLKHFDEIYEKLGTTFDYFIFESMVAELGVNFVKEHTGDVFEDSEGAVIYKGEQDGLHTRVFMNQQELPTYETKEIGLALRKETLGKFDESVVITAVEQQQYFKVVMAALSKVKPEIAEKTKHIVHGMMEFSGGKMSSRTGNIITGESLLNDIEQQVVEKVADRNLNQEEVEQIKNVVSVAALKYSILKQTPGKNIVFDPTKAISFEGDSGPYVQYTYIRAKSILAKATEQKIISNSRKVPEGWETTDLEKVLYRFPEVIERAMAEAGPQYVVTYMTLLAGAFNTFYAQSQILDGSDTEGYKLAITEAVMTVLANSLKVLGIKTPVKM